MKYSPVTILAVTLLWSVSGCVNFATKREVASLQELPTSYSVYSAAQQTSGRWWRDFQRADLNNLIHQGLAQNLDLDAAWARLRQAEALAKQAGAERSPTVNLLIGASTTGSGSDLGNLNYQQGSNAGLDAAWEVDLWGRIRAGKRSAELNAIARGAAVEATALTLTGELTNRWLNVIAQEKITNLLGEQLKANKTYLELIELRFQKSLATALDVSQQQQAVASIRSKIPLAEEQAILLRHQLAVLLGKSPTSAVKISLRQLPSLPSLPARGVPADLLQQRPDIRAAAAEVAAGDQEVAQAIADRFPKVSLTARASSDPEYVRDLFDNWLANLAANAVAPIIDGRRRHWEVKKQHAQVDEKIATYRKVVLTALREVEDALVSERKQTEYLQAAREELSAAKNSLEHASNRYRKGLNDYLPVLTALVQVQNLERALVGMALV